MIDLLKIICVDIYISLDMTTSSGTPLHLCYLQLFALLLLLLHLLLNCILPPPPCSPPPSPTPQMLFFTSTSSTFCFNYSSSCPCFTGFIISYRYLAMNSQIVNSLEILLGCLTPPSVSASTSPPPIMITFIVKFNRILSFQSCNLNQEYLLL